MFECPANAAELRPPIVQTRQSRTQVSSKAAKPPSHVRALPMHLPSYQDGLGISAFRQPGLLITRPPDLAPASPARPEQKKTGPKPDGATIYTPGFKTKGLQREVPVLFKYAMLPMWLDSRYHGQVLALRAYCACRG